MASVLRDRCGQRGVHATSPGRPHPSASTRDRAQALETTTNDRPQPRRPGNPTAERVASRLRRTQVHVGAQPHPGGRPGHARGVLHRARPRPPGSSAPRLPSEHHRPQPSRRHRGGDRSRSITGRRRGQQPAVPKSRVRPAQARFRGSRGGQPPRLPDSRAAALLDGAATRSYSQRPTLNSLFRARPSRPHPECRRHPHPGCPPTTNASHGPDQGDGGERGWGDAEPGAARRRWASTTRSWSRPA